MHAVVFHTLTLNNTITTTTSTENTVTKSPIYTIAQNHTMLRTCLQKCECMSVYNNKSLM